MFGLISHLGLVTLLHYLTQTKLEINSKSKKWTLSPTLLVDQGGSSPIYPNTGSKNGTVKHRENHRKYKKDKGQRTLSTTTLLDY